MRKDRVYIVLLLTILLSASAACRFHSLARSDAKPGRNPVKSDPVTDWDSDGIPDRAELKTEDDRESFRRWFTAIAEHQFHEISDEWTREQQDCAGLIRFAWREALRTHDRRWFQRFKSFTQPVAPDVRAIALDRNPLGGERLFLTDTGSFSEFADARTLMTQNCVFVSQDRRHALAGDLLFYHQPWIQRFPYHVMIYTGQDDFVVYHTGGSATDQGEVRKVRLSLLDRHPNARWRPVTHNVHFLGFYRLKILN
jgi:uncharacterized protein